MRPAQPTPPDAVGLTCCRFMTTATGCGLRRYSPHHWRRLWCPRPRPRQEWGRRLAIFGAAGAAAYLSRSMMNHGGRTGRRMNLKDVLVVLDASPASEARLRLAMCVARDHGASLSAVYMLDDREDNIPHGPGVLLRGVAAQMLPNMPDIPQSAMFSDSAEQQLQVSATAPSVAAAIGISLTGPIRRS